MFLFTENDDDRIKLRIQRGGSLKRFAILRCAKIKTLGNMGASLQHTFRERETPNADPARIQDNTILLGADNSRGVLDAWKTRAPEKVRKNAVHGLEYFIGGSPEALGGKSREEQDAYFRDALDWIKQRHGAENVLSAVIHRDETTPHMSVMTIPLDERGKLNARALVGNRQKLSDMQTDFAETVGEPHGLERGLRGSQITHERVKRAYGRISAPEVAMSLPERRTGGLLGRGRETDEEWHLRASQAATEALQDAYATLDRERRDHEARTYEMFSALQYAEASRDLATEDTVNELRTENADLSKQVTAWTREAQELTDQLDQGDQIRRQLVDSALKFVEAHGLDYDRFFAHLERELGLSDDRQIENTSPTYDQGDDHSL